MKKEKLVERNGLPVCPGSEFARVRHSAKIDNVGVSLRKVNIIPAPSGSLIPTYRSQKKLSQGELCLVNAKFPT